MGASTGEANNNTASPRIANSRHPAPVAVKERLWNWIGLDATLKHLLSRLGPRLVPDIPSPSGCSLISNGEKSKWKADNLRLPSATVVELVHRLPLDCCLGCGEEEQEEKFCRERNQRRLNQRQVI